MRIVFALLAAALYLAAGCQPAQSPAVAAPIDIGPLVAEVARLGARVAELEARPAGKAARVPHLVHAETGEDYGVMMDWSTAWRDDVGGAVRVVATSIVYAEPDCRGAASISYTDVWPVVIADGRIVERRGHLAPARAASLRPTSGPCVPVGGMMDSAPFDDTGIVVAPAVAWQVAVAMR